MSLLTAPIVKQSYLGWNIHYFSKKCLKANLKATNFELTEKIRKAATKYGKF